MSKEKSESEKPVCFVLMPIADVIDYDTGHFGRVYEHLLKPAILAAGYVPVRADDTVKTDYIVVGIIQKIVESAMVVCDFSSRNPNVMYELGIRHAFNKSVVLVKDRKTEKIFDIQGLRYTEYDETLRIDSVNKDISKINSAIRETAEGGPEAMNSIVQLAGIKTAEAPKNQTISADTGLILSAISVFDKRLEMVEQMERRTSRDIAFRDYKRSVNFLSTGDVLILNNGRAARRGGVLFVHGHAIGQLLDWNLEKGHVEVKGTDGVNKLIKMGSEEYLNLDTKAI